MILSIFRNLRAKIIGAKVGHFVSLDRRGNFVDSGYGYQDLRSPLPEVSSADNGKVLAVVSGDWSPANVNLVPPNGHTGEVLTKDSSGYGWAEVPKELPDGAQDGDVLTWVAGDPEWRETQTELPTHSSATAGKFLRVNSDGTLYWDTVSAGTGLYLHHIRVWKTNNSQNIIAEGYFDILTTNLYPSAITTLTALDDMLGYMVGNRRIPANGFYMTSANAGYTHEYLVFNGTYFAFHYYGTPNAGIIDPQGLVIDPTDSDLHMQDDLTTL